MAHRELAGRGAREEIGVLRQCTGPTALDEADPDLVEQPGDGQLVGDGVADALALRAVAQRGVEDVEVVGLHRSSFGWRQQKTPCRDGRG